VNQAIVTCHFILALKGPRTIFCAWATLDHRHIWLMFGYFWCYRKVSWISTV